MRVGPSGRQGHVRVVRVIVGAPMAVVADGGQESRRGVENKVPDAESALLDGGVGAELSFLRRWRLE